MFNALTGYIAGAFGLVALGMGGVILYQKVEIAKQETQLTTYRDALATAVQANKDQTTAIDTLKDNQKVSNELSLNLQNATAIVEGQSRQMDDALRKLEGANNDVRALLTTSLPADLKRLLRNRPGTTGGAGVKGSDLSPAPGAHEPLR